MFERYDCGEYGIVPFLSDEGEMVYHSDAMEVVGKLEKENNLLQAKLDAYELYEGRIDDANHKSNNSRIDDADEELQETLRELEELS